MYPGWPQPFYIANQSWSSCLHLLTTRITRVFATGPSLFWLGIKGFADVRQALYWPSSTPLPNPGVTHTRNVRALGGATPPYPWLVLWTFVYQINYKSENKALCLAFSDSRLVLILSVFRSESQTCHFLLSKELLIVCQGKWAPLSCVCLR